MPAVYWVSVACIGVGFDSSAAVRPMARQDAEAEASRRADKWQMAADVLMGAVKPGTTRPPDRTEGMDRMRDGTVTRPEASQARMTR